MDAAVQIESDFSRKRKNSAGGSYLNGRNRALKRSSQTCSPQCSTPSPSNIGLENGDTDVDTVLKDATKLKPKSVKMKIQLFPATEAIMNRLAKEGINPYLELTLKNKKSITSVINHIHAKWKQIPGDISGIKLFSHQKFCPETLHNGFSWGIHNGDVTVEEIRKFVSLDSDTLQLRYAWQLSDELLNANELGAGVETRTDLLVKTHNCPANISPTRPPEFINLTEEDAVENDSKRQPCINNEDKENYNPGLRENTELNDESFAFLDPQFSNNSWIGSFFSSRDAPAGKGLELSFNQAMESHGQEKGELQASDLRLIADSKVGKIECSTSSPGATDRLCYFSHLSELNSTQRATTDEVENHLPPPNPEFNAIVYASEMATNGQSLDSFWNVTLGCPSQNPSYGVQPALGSEQAAQFSYDKCAEDSSSRAIAELLRSDPANWETSKKPELQEEAQMGCSKEDCNLQTGPVDSGKLKGSEEKQGSYFEGLDWEDSRDIPKINPQALNSVDCYIFQKMESQDLPVNSHGFSSFSSKLGLGQESEGPTGFKNILQSVQQNVSLFDKPSNEP